MKVDEGSAAASIKSPVNHRPDRGPAAPAVLLADTSKWACSARLAIALSKAGVAVSAICPAFDHPLLKTRAVRRSYSYSALYPAEALAGAIAEVNPDVVIPCDDRAVEHLHELHAKTCAVPSQLRVADLIERSLGPRDSFLASASRQVFLEAAEQAGARVPRTRLLSCADDLTLWAGEQPLPWVLKADGTWGGKGVNIVRSLQDARRSFSKLTRFFGTARAVKRLVVNHDPFWLRPAWRRTKPAVVVQSFVQGRPANCAFLAWHGAIQAGFSVEVVSTAGPTAPATVVRVVDNAEMKRAAELVARRLGLSGFFGLDFVIEDATGDAYLIEMNPRITPLCHLQLGRERDMVRALGEMLSGTTLPSVAPVTQNELIAYFPDALLYQSDLLESCYLDVPEGEPELVEDLLRPIPNKKALARMQRAMADRCPPPKPAVQPRML